MPTIYRNNIALEFTLSQEGKPRVSAHTSVAILEAWLGPDTTLRALSVLAEKQIAARLKLGQSLEGSLIVAVDSESSSSSSASLGIDFGKQIEAELTKLNRWSMERMGLKRLELEASKVSRKIAQIDAQELRAVAARGEKHPLQIELAKLCRAISAVEIRLSSDTLPAIPTRFERSPSPAERDFCPHHLRTPQPQKCRKSKTNC